MRVHFRHPEKIDATICKQLVRMKNGDKLFFTLNNKDVTCQKCLSRIRVLDRKRKIVYALSLMPMTRKRLGEVVGTYKLNEFVSYLTAAGIVCMNQSSKCLELQTEVMVKP